MHHYASSECFTFSLGGYLMHKCKMRRSIVSRFAVFLSVRILAGEVRREQVQVVASDQGHDEADRVKPLPAVSLRASQDQHRGQRLFGLHQD